jgi:hypothetical protein
VGIVESTLRWWRKRHDARPARHVCTEQIFERSEAFGDSLDWDALLTNWCVVVLGEAGTGKTTEFQRQVDRLVADERQAFFITIEELADKELAATLSAADSERLTKWESSADEARFFLDSLDEAKLQGDSLTKALKSWGRAIQHKPLAARHSDAKKLSCLG